MVLESRVATALDEPSPLDNPILYTLTFVDDPEVLAALRDTVEDPS
jgi:hypothetical protein